MPQDSGAEHLVVDHLHRIVLLVKLEVGQIGGGGGKGARGRFQVQAEEHAPAEVLEHRHQAGIAQPGTLCMEPAQVGLSGDLLSGEPRQLAPAAGKPGLGPWRRREEPFYEGRGELGRSYHRKKWTGMDVGLGINAALLRLEAARDEPVKRRAAQPAG
jgi:hypothetical protein